MLDWKVSKLIKHAQYETKSRSNLRQERGTPDSLWAYEAINLDRKVGLADSEDQWPELVFWQILEKYHSSNDSGRTNRARLSSFGGEIWRDSSDPEDWYSQGPTQGSRMLWCKEDHNICFNLRASDRTICSATWILSSSAISWREIQWIRETRSKVRHGISTYSWPLRHD